MLLRIFLILSILAGGGIIAMTHLKVRPHVQSIIDERESQKDRANKNEAGWKKTQRELTDTKSTLQKTQQDLSETSSQLAATTKRANDLDTQAKNLKGKLDKTTQDLLVANQDLEAWRILGYTVDQVKGVISDNKKLTNDLAMAKLEYDILQKAHLRLGVLYTNVISGSEIDIVQPLPAGLKGRVLVVDPKWDFVVLDVGEKQGALPHGVLMVSRDSKLVAKIKIVSVQVDRSIANIMPGWKLGDVMEGDQVIWFQ